MTINISRHLKPKNNIEMKNPSVAEEMSFDKKEIGDGLPVEAVEISVSKKELVKVENILDKYTEKEFYNFDFVGAMEELTALTRAIDISEYKLLFLLAKLSGKYSDQTRQLIDSFADGMSSEVLVQISKEMMWRSEVSEGFKTALIGVMRYKHAFDETHEQKLLQTIDFSQPGEVFKVSAWLDFLRRLYANAYFETAKKKSINIQEELLQKYRESGKDTIYFLDLQIKDLLQQMDAGLAELDLRRDKYPFKVSGNLYGIHKNGRLYVADQKDNKKILDIIKRIEVLEKSSNGNRKLVNELYDEMIGSFDKSVDIQKPSNLSEEEWKKEYFNYSCLMRKPIREVIQADFDFSLEELSVKEQFYFLNYAKHYSVKDVKRLQEFTKQYGVQGARTFLSLEHGRLEMGEKILAIGEKFEKTPTIADAIFGKYAELVDAANNIEDYLIEQFGKENSKVAQEIAEDLLIRGRAILVMFANEEMTEKEVMERLGEINVDMLFNLNIFKRLENKGKIQDIKGASFEIIKTEKYKKMADEILEIAHTNDYSEYAKDEATVDIIQMFKLFDQSYNDRPELRDILKKNFAETITNQETLSRLYIIKIDGRIVAFDRVTDIEEGKKQFGSCNVLSLVQRLSLGEAVFLETIKKEDDGSEIIATSDAFTPFSSVYIEQGGFQVVDIDTKSDPDNIPWFILKKPSSQLSKDDFFAHKNIIEEYEKHQYDRGKSIIRKFSGNDDMLNMSLALVRDSYKITRYVIDDKKDKYLAFEKVS